MEATTVQSISLEGVSFSYRSAPDKVVLEDVSMKLERGKVVALVGKYPIVPSSLEQFIGESSHYI